MFGGRFGMNVKEVVAILGGHTVGRAQYDISGFDGGWTSSQSSFSNEYYKSFGQVPWNNNNHSAVWTDGGRANIMLMADVELLFNSNSKGQGTCNSLKSIVATANCQLHSQSNAAFLAYANDMSQWFGNFSTAWPKMTEYGFADVLVDVGNTPIASIYPAVNGTYVPTTSPTEDPVVATTPASASVTKSNPLSVSLRSSASLLGFAAAGFVVSCVVVRLFFRRYWCCSVRAVEEKCTTQPTCNHVDKNSAVV
jgi:hypothetical protein